MNIQLLNRIKIAVILLAVAVIAVLAINTQPTMASNERIVTVYYDGIEKTVVTSATTVQEVLNKIDVQLTEYDNVEPALTTELTAPTYTVNVYRARPVLVVDGDSRRTVMTAHASGKQIAEDAGLTVYPEDEYEFSRIDEFVSEGSLGLKMTIDRAAPVTIALYGSEISLRTQETTVGGLLESRGINISDQDYVSLDNNTPISPEMRLEIWRNGEQMITVEEDISFAVEQVRDTTKEIGYHAVQTPGVLGKRVVTYTVNMQDGVEVGRSEAQSVIISEPQKQIEVIGWKYNGVYTSPSENEVITWNFLTTQGFTREQTAGIMGNLQMEHGFKTDGDGLAQWTGGRKSALLSRPDPYSVYTQLDYLMYELNGGYSRVRDAIRASSTVEDATIIFQDRFEKCGICRESQRIQFAYNILASH